VSTTGAGQQGAMAHQDAMEVGDHSTRAVQPGDMTHQVPEKPDNQYGNLIQM